MNDMIKSILDEAIENLPKVYIMWDQAAQITLYHFKDIPIRINKDEKCMIAEIQPGLFVRIYARYLERYGIYVEITSQSGTTLAEFAKDLEGNINEAYGNIYDKSLKQRMMNYFMILSDITWMTPTNEPNTSDETPVEELDTDNEPEHVPLDEVISPEEK